MDLVNILNFMSDMYHDGGEIHRVITSPTRWSYREDSMQRQRTFEQETAKYRRGRVTKMGKRDIHAHIVATLQDGFHYKAN